MLAQLLNQARRRVLAQLALDKGALALAIGMGGLILLLLIGTQVLDWYWPVLLALVSLGVGLYSLRKHVPSLYQLAQRIDRKLALADSISTALYFSEHPKDGFGPVCSLQYRDAEAKAASVDLKAALPYTRSRYLIPAGGLLLVAAGLFAVRYAVVGSLDLQPSLIEMAVDTFFSSPQREEPQKLPLRADLRPEAFDPTQPETPPDLEQQTDIPLENKDADQLTKGDQQQDAKMSDKGTPDNQQQEGDQDQKGDEQKAQPNDKQGDKQGGESKEGDDGSSQENQQQEERSMLDKLRDAVSNLMNKMNSNNSQKNPQQNAKGKQQQSSKDKQSSGEKGDDKAERAQGEPQADQNQKGDQSDKQQADAQQAPGNRPSEQAASGSGSQDGEKKAQEAKMLEAMGKVSEILGQRSQEVTGQMMVEVGNTKQQLRTQFTQQAAGHAEAGSEIHRDEVPLMYQQFVERYFEEVRKGTQQAGAPKAPTPAKSN